MLSSVSPIVVYSVIINELQGEMMYRFCLLAAVLLLVSLLTQSMPTSAIHAAMLQSNVVMPDSDVQAARPSSTFTAPTNTTAEETRECPPSRSSSRFVPPKCSEVTFVVDKEKGLDTGCQFKTIGPLIFTLVVDRYPGDIDKLLKQGLASQNAVLRLPAYDIDYDNTEPYVPERDIISLNGKSLGYLTGENNVWKLNTFSIPLQDIKFGTVDQNGKLTPGLNEIRIDIDIANTNAVWCTAIDWATLSVSLPSPLLMVHGILSDGMTWYGNGKDKLPWWPKGMEELGIPTDTITMSGRFGSPIALDSIQNNAEKIDRKVQQLRQKWGVDKINIVAHSKGGLDSRHYIEEHDTVARLVQIGTPNAGSRLADEVQLGSILLAGKLGPYASLALALGELANPAAYQLTTPYMRTYNFFHGHNFKTSYISLGGDYRAPTTSIWDFLLPNPHDNVVPLASVHALDYAAHLTYPNVLANQPVPSVNDAKHTEQTTSKGIYEQLTPFVRTQQQDDVAPQLNTQSALSASPQQKLTSQTASVQLLQQTADTKHVKAFPDIIAQGEVKTYQVEMDAATTYGFLLYHEGGNIDLSIIAPDGTTITPDTSTSNTAVTFDRLDDPAGMNTESYTIANPASGVYQMRVTAISIASDSGSQPFFVTTLSKGAAITLNASTNKPFYSSGEPIIIQAQLANSADALVDAQAIAHIVLPDNTTTADITLLDNGDASTGDQQANDGIYSGRIVSSQSGLYRMVVSANKSNAPAFTRETLLDAPVSASTSRIGTSLTSFVQDTNSNGLYDTLTVRVPLTITKKGVYRLRGTLIDSAGHTVDTALIKQELNIGTRTLDLSFDGERIYQNAIDGPYSLGTLQLLEEDSFATLPLDQKDNAHTTKTYSYQQFEHSAIILSNKGTDTGIDTNNNGKFEQLQVSLNVDLLKGGTYEWTGLLLDQNGKEVGFSASKADLVAGTNKITFLFDGIVIEHSKSNGPYTLNSVLIFSTSASSVSFELYTTGNYTVDQFERREQLMLPLIVRAQ